MRAFWLNALMLEYLSFMKCCQPIFLLKISQEERWIIINGLQFYISYIYFAHTHLHLTFEEITVSTCLTVIIIYNKKKIYNYRNWVGLKMEIEGFLLLRS